MLHNVYIFLVIFPLVLLRVLCTQWNWMPSETIGNSFRYSQNPIGKCECGIDKILNKIHFPWLKSKAKLFLYSVLLLLNWGYVVEMKTKMLKIGNEEEETNFHPSHWQAVLDGKECKFVNLWKLDNLLLVCTKWEKKWLFNCFIFVCTLGLSNRGRLHGFGCCPHSQTALSFSTGHLSN